MEVSPSGHSSYTPQLYRHDAGLQQFACWAICNLALADDENKQKMRQSGLLEVEDDLIRTQFPYRCVTLPWRLMRTT